MAGPLLLQQGAVGVLAGMTKNHSPCVGQVFRGNESANQVAKVVKVAFACLLVKAVGADPSLVKGILGAEADLKTKAAGGSTSQRVVSCLALWSKHKALCASQLLPTELVCMRTANGLLAVFSISS